MISYICQCRTLFNKDNIDLNLLDIEIIRTAIRTLSELVLCLIVDYVDRNLQRPTFQSPRPVVTDLGEQIRPSVELIPGQ